MLYGEKLKSALKNEQNAVNKMYLNELILNWAKVETAFTEKSESPIVSVVTALSEYTQHLSIPKFLYNKDKGIGFPDDHDIFKPLYLYDLAERLLLEAGISISGNNKKGNGGGVVVRNKTFHTAVKLENNHYKSISQTPQLEFANSNKCLYCGLEFDIQYRLGGKKNFFKTKLIIPLIVFYIEKCYGENSFKEIAHLQKDTFALNPNAILICLTEIVDRRFTKLYNPIKDIVYIARAGFKGDMQKPLQPQVFLKIYSKLYNYTHKELLGYDKYVPFGHMDLYQDIEIQPEPKDPNKLSRRQQKKAAFEERRRQKMEKKSKEKRHQTIDKRQQTSRPAPYTMPSSTKVDDKSDSEVKTKSKPISIKITEPEKTSTPIWIAPPPTALGLKFGTPEQKEKKTKVSKSKTNDVVEPEYIQPTIVDPPKEQKTATPRRLRRPQTVAAIPSSPSDLKPKTTIATPSSPPDLKTQTSGDDTPMPVKRGRGRPKKS